VDHFDPVGQGVNKLMLTIYFSGTGNTEYLARLFSNQMDAACLSIEDDANFTSEIKKHDTIAFCYPIYGSRVPRIMREFVIKHMSDFSGKRLIILVTQVLFSGDGARVFTDMFRDGAIEVIYAEHFYMPNNVTNVAILPGWLISDKVISKLNEKAERKMTTVCNNIEKGKVKKRGFCIGSRISGLLQAWMVPLMEKHANKSVKISAECDICGICATDCPMKNLAIENNSVIHKHNCTVCYRCVNECPKKAITVAHHGKVRKQYKRKCEPL